MPDPIETPSSQQPAPAAPAPPKKPKQLKKQDAVDHGIWRTGRRSFVQAFGWLSFLGFLTVSTVGALRMMFPRILFERSPMFKAGKLEDYTSTDSVDEKFKDEHRVWILRTSDRILALSATCTHLGCTPRWLLAENKFKCPCHGSGFRGFPVPGINFEGPAPRALDRYGIGVNEEGTILVDKAKIFLYEKGGWEKPGSYIPV